jgi:formylglycine-generating enzyme required for sulfatase activity
MFPVWVALLAVSPLLAAGCGGGSLGAGGGAKDTGEALKLSDGASYDIPATTAGEAITPIDVSGAASGGTQPYTFSATGLPAGITISAAGVISGTPVMKQDAGRATVAVTDGKGAKASIMIDYGAVGLAPITFGDGYDIPAMTVGQAIDPIDLYGAVRGGQAPYTFEATGLPDGLRLDPGGVISGTPAADAPAGNATVTVTDALGDTASIEMGYGASSWPELVFVGSEGYDIPAATVGVKIRDIDVSGGVGGGKPPYTFEATGLPAGMTVSAAGVISGTPLSAAAAGDATITVKDDATPQASKGIAIAYGKVFDITLKPVAGGAFQMGCTAKQAGDCESAESPEHEVALTKDFYVGETEVTQAQWREVMDWSAEDLAARLDVCGAYGRGDDHPMYCVSWEDITEEGGFLAKLNAATGRNYRLPTEAEWEYAARGGADGPAHDYKYSGSDTIDDVAWYRDNSSLTTHEVGKLAANELGLYDMSGNVWEWVSDWHDSSYYSVSPAADPTGSATGAIRVIRGGSWIHLAEYVRVAYRAGDTPDHRIGDLGFRLALDQ